MKEQFSKDKLNWHDKRTDDDKYVRFHTGESISAVYAIENLNLEAKIEHVEAQNMKHKALYEETFSTKNMVERKLSSTEQELYTVKKQNADLISSVLNLSSKIGVK